MFSQDKYKLCIVANAVRDRAQANIIENFARIVKRYLGLTPHILGYLPYEPLMDQAISSRTPFVVKYPQSAYVRGMREIVKNIYY